MRDGCAGGRVFGAFEIDVNELVIVGAVGEFVDAILVDGEPLGRRELFADPGFELFEGDGGGHWIVSGW